MARQESSEEARRKELADLLRTRRERLMPELFDLPRRGRRRTPGLRREDVAELIDVSVTWYTWLEQGRAIHISLEVAERLARVLQLNADERSHFFQLARQPLPPASSTLSGTVQPAFRDMLSALEPAPAHIRDERWNVLAWNSAETILDDWGAYPPEERNVVWHHFAHPRLRRLMVNWEQEARTLLALFRMASAQHLDDPWFATMIERLQQVSSEFRQWWTLHEVRQQRELPITFSYPEAGLLILQPVTVQFAYDRQLSMRVLLPSPGTDAAARLAQLVSTRIASERHTEAN